MTTREHIEALEMQRDELRGRIAELELQPGQDLIRMRETIQYEREWRRKAESQSANMRAALEQVEWIYENGGECPLVSRSHSARPQVRLCATKGARILIAALSLRFLLSKKQRRSKS